MRSLRRGFQLSRQFTLLDSLRLTRPKATSHPAEFSPSPTLATAKLLQQQDAEKIAAYIRSEVDAGRRHFKDFLILTRKKRDRIAPYANALKSLNIPVEVSGAGAFGESAEVKALTALLRALSDPLDALALIAVLRGPLFGISDQELFAFKQAGGWFSMFQRPQ